MNKKIKIAQIGTFDVENYGDLLFPTILKSKLSDYEIDLFSPKGGNKPFEEEIFVNKIEDLEQMHLKNNYGAIIIGGGDLIRVDPYVAPKTYGVSIDPSLLVWQLPIIIGKKYNIPVIFNCPGVPYEFKKCEQPIVKTILQNVDYLTVRDNNSKKILESCGLKNVNVSPDTILCIDEILKLNKLKGIKEKLEENEKIPKISNYIAIQHNKTNIDNKQYIDQLKKLIDLIINKYHKNVVLVPIGYVHNDIEFLEKIYDENNKNISIIRNKLSPIEMLSVFSNSDGYIGTSMHGAITTYAYDKPILVINTKKMVKINGLLKEIDKENIEVININNIFDIFDKFFFKKSNLRVKKNVKNNINCHFEKIKDMIDKNNLNNSNYEFKLLKSVFDSLSNVNEYDLEHFKIYFNYGEGFNENLIEKIKINKIENSIDFEFDVPMDVKEVRIDPFEGFGIKYNSIKITSNDRKLDYFIPFKYELNDCKYILSTDPNILIKIDSEIKRIKFSICMELLNYDDIFKMLIYIFEQNYENNSKLSLYENLYKNTINYKLRKIFKK